MTTTTSTAVGMIRLAWLKAEKKWMLCGNRTCAARTATTIDYNMRRPHTIELPRNVYKTPHIFLDILLLSHGILLHACDTTNSFRSRATNARRKSRQTDRKKWKSCRNKSHRPPSIKHLWDDFSSTQWAWQINRRTAAVLAVVTSATKFNLIEVYVLHTVFHVAVP